MRVGRKLLLVVASSALVACQGPPGPKGDQGSPGPAGPTAQAEAASARDLSTAYGENCSVTCRGGRQCSRSCTNGKKAECSCGALEHIYAEDGTLLDGMFVRPPRHPPPYAPSELRKHEPKWDGERPSCECK